MLLPVLEHCSSAVDTHVKQLDSVVSFASFLNQLGVCLSVTLRIGKSVAVLSILNKIKCNPMHPLDSALLVPLCQFGLHAVLCSHSGTAEPRCRTSQ